MNQIEKLAIRPKSVVLQRSLWEVAKLCHAPLCELLPENLYLFYKQYLRVVWLVVIKGNGYAIKF